MQATTGNSFLSTHAEDIALAVGALLALISYFVTATPQYSVPLLAFAALIKAVWPGATAQVQAVPTAGPAAAAATIPAPGTALTPLAPGFLYYYWTGTYPANSLSNLIGTNTDPATILKAGIMPPGTQYLGPFASYANATSAAQSAGLYKP